MGAAEYFNRGLSQTYRLLNRQIGPPTAFGHNAAGLQALRILTDRRPFGLCDKYPYSASPNRNFHPEGRTMTDMKDRQEGFERKFALDEEQKFRAMARRNKMLGLWAAEKLGKSGADADAYAKEVVNADFEEAGDHDVFRKIRKDFDAAGVEQSDHQIRRTMDELMATAAEQVKNG